MTHPDPDNPLAPLTAEQRQKIRERAYYLWLHDGCPEDRADEYWERARELQAIADHADAALEPNPASNPDADRTVEEAEIQENLGEFPSAYGLTDQGDRRMEPMTREEAQREGRKE